MRWDPLLYGGFGGHRLRPALDLLDRVPLEAPAVACDLGCGSGAATRLLAGRWPAARLIGVDSSAEMLAEARRQRPEIDWRREDVAHWRPEAPPDLIFSNAALHWLDHHPILFRRLFAALAPGGVLAVQMPRNHHAPSHAAIADMLTAPRWRRLAPLLRASPVAAPAAYYDLLAAEAASVDVWETEYLHVLDGDDPVVRWTSGTALAPLLQALDAGERADFRAEYAARMAAAYPRRADGRTLMPFRRLFVVATR